MAIPKTLRTITKEQAERIVEKHPDGWWEGAAWCSDFIYEGRLMPKYGTRRREMVRARGGIYETGVVSM